MKRALLVGPRLTSAESLAELLKEAAAPSPGSTERALWVAVDGGLIACRALGLVPDLAVGDWDSLPGGSKDPALLGLKNRVDLHPSKDRSDLHAAAVLSLQQGTRELDCFGVTGGRADHQLATLLDLSELSDSPAVDRLETWDEHTRCVFVAPAMGEVQIPARPGALFSVFGLGGPARLSIRGARFELSDAWLQPSSHGLSNEVGSGIATLRVASGRVVVMIPRVSQN